MFTARDNVKFDCRRPVGYGGFSLRMATMLHEFKLSGERFTLDYEMSVF